MILRGNYCGLIVTTETPLKQIMLRLYPIAIRSRQHLSETWPSAVCRCRGVDYFLAIETPKEPHSTGNASHHQRLLLSGKNTSFRVTPITAPTRPPSICRTSSCMSPPFLKEGCNCPDCSRPPQGASGSRGGRAADARLYRFAFDCAKALESLLPLGCVVPSLPEKSA